VDDVARSGVKDVVVIGAGISGIVAAYELERLGHRVEVLEAAPWPGGRIHTHRFGEGVTAPFVELGAMRIPAHHRHTMSYVDELGLTTRLSTFRSLFSDEGAYHTTSVGFIRVKDAAQTLVAEFRQAYDPKGVHYRREVLLFGSWLAAIGDAIAPANFRGGPRGEIIRELIGLAQDVDLAPFLRGEAADRFDLHGFFAEHPQIRQTGSGRLHRFLDDILSETSPDLVRLDGGMDQLPLGLAARLRGPVHRDHEVVGIEVGEDDVVLRVRHGGRTSVRRADYALCTIPFSVLRAIPCSGISAAKRAIIDEVAYWSATKVAFLCREPFWEDDGISGGASFTGGRVRQTYYPPVEGDRARGAVLLASYTMGDDADVLGRLPKAERHAVVLDEVAAMHPQLAQPDMVLETVSRAWGQHPWTLGGGVTRWGKDTEACIAERDAAARPEGRLFFAGEHCSSTTAWIDGAIESAVDAVRRIVAFEPHPPVGAGVGS